MRNLKAFFLLILALGLSLAAALYAGNWMAQQKLIASGRVVVAAADIQLGTRITPQMLTTIDWPTGARPPGSFSELKDVQERVLKSGLLRGEPVLEGKLAPVGTQGGLSAVIAEGKRAITVRVNDVIGVAGFALPGNYVDIIVSTRKEGHGRDQAEQNISKIVLERILVLAVAQEVSRDDTKPRVVNAVTLEVSPDQAEKLDLARSVGSLSLALRNQIDPKPGITSGATKLSLLDEKVPAKVEKKVVAARPVSYVPQTCVGVTNGAQGSRECY